MKIGFITTINTNIGDDFIRTGIENVISLFKKPVQFTYVNKHHPEQVLSPNSPLHFLNKLPSFRGKRRLENIYYHHLHQYFNVYADQDLIIQSGAPVLWPGCYNCEWNIPIWDQTIGKIYKSNPVLNFAAGSCYPWERQEGFADEKEKQFANKIGGYCRVTTTRDRLSHKLFTQAGVENHLIPCTALMVNKEYQSPEGKYILVNYMEAGGHYDWGQNINAAEWENTIKKIIDELLRFHDVRFICHNEKEVASAEKLYPGLKVHFPKTVENYLECIQNAKAGINNRMHASVAMASMGIPAVSICTDTRLLMLEQIGLPVYYVKDATAAKILTDINSFVANPKKERDRLFAIKEKTFAQYKNILEPYCG